MMTSMFRLNFRCPPLNGDFWGTLCCAAAAGYQMSCIGPPHWAISPASEAPKETTLSPLQGFCLSFSLSGCLWSNQTLRQGSAVVGRVLVRIERYGICCLCEFLRYLLLSSLSMKIINLPFQLQNTIFIWTLTCESDLKSYTEGCSL